MSTDYDAIAEGYRRAKGHPWRECIETFTLMDLVGDVSGRSVLDVACGEGFYTRKLKAAGAGRVLGVDLSEGMIDLARRQEAETPSGIAYEVGDGSDLHLAREFDVAVAAYLLNYARTAEELLAMCRGIAGALRPGRFVAVNANPDLDFRFGAAYREYGFEVAADGPVAEGSPFTWTFHVEGGPIRVENYHLDRRTHDAAREAGFRDVTWFPPRLSPSEDPSQWNTLLEHPPVVFLTCHL